jgi:hypothetical protein
MNLTMLEGLFEHEQMGEKKSVFCLKKLQGCDCKLMYEDGSSAYYKIEYSDSRLVFGQRTCSHNEFFLMKQK